MEFALNKFDREHCLDFYEQQGITLVDTILAKDIYTIDTDNKIRAIAGAYSPVGQEYILWVGFIAADKGLSQIASIYAIKQLILSIKNIHQDKIICLNITPELQRLAAMLGYSVNHETIQCFSVMEGLKS